MPQHDFTSDQATLVRERARRENVRVDTHVFAVPEGPDQPLLLDLYRPTNVAGPLPVIVFVHGGAFMLGDRYAVPDMVRYFARDGFAMASIEYRLVPHITFPANVEDVRTAVRWLRGNAAQLGIDADRIALWGTSAGGYLAAMAGVLDEDLFAGNEHRNHSSKVRCVLDGYGPTDMSASKRFRAQEQSKLEPIKPEIEKLPNPRVEGEKSMTPEVKSMLMRAEELMLGDLNEEKLKASNPATYVKRDTPPFLIMHGLADSSVAYSHSIQFYEALVAAGAEATLRLIHGVPHTFFNMPGFDDVVGPCEMEVRSYVPGKAEMRTTDAALLFDVARQFFKQHLA